MIWQHAALLTLAFAAAAALVRLFGGRRASVWIWQATVVVALYTVWQIALDALVVSTTGAVAHGRGIVRVERWVHLPSERWFQSLFLHDRPVMDAANRFYANVDFPVMGVCLLWLWWRHRDRYRPLRLVLVLTSAFAAVVQAVPFAPPRLLPGLGVVDAGVLYHYAVYSPGGLSQPGQLTSMPSVHVAWAGFVAYAAISASRSKWRWLILLYPIATIVVVVVTGNHYWLDGIAGLALLALADGLVRLDIWHRLYRGISERGGGRRGADSGIEGGDAVPSSAGAREPASGA